MRRAFLALAVAVLAATAQAQFVTYTLKGTVSSVVDETGTTAPLVGVGDSFQLSGTVFLPGGPRSGSLWLSEWNLVGITSVAIGAYSHDFTDIDRFDSVMGPYPDPDSYVWGADHPDGNFTMASGIPASLGRTFATGYLDDYTNTAITNLAPPMSVDVADFATRGLKFDYSVFDYEIDQYDPFTGELTSTPYYKTDEVLASLDSVTLSQSAVPEPPPIAGFGVGLAVLGLVTRRLKR